MTFFCFQSFSLRTVLAHLSASVRTRTMEKTSRSCPQKVKIIEKTYFLRKFDSDIQLLLNKCLTSQFMLTQNIKNIKAVTL